MSDFWVSFFISFTLGILGGSVTGFVYLWSPRARRRRRRSFEAFKCVLAAQRAVHRADQLAALVLLEAATDLLMGDESSPPFTELFDEIEKREEALWGSP